MCVKCEIFVLGLKLDDVTAQDYRFPLFEEAVRRYHKHPERMLRNAVASDLWIKKATLPEELQAPEGSSVQGDEMADHFEAVRREHFDDRFYKK